MANDDSQRISEGERQLQESTQRLYEQSTRDCDEVVMVPMTVADALGVGHSMRTLVRGRKLPPGTGDIYNRVSGSMISEARKAMAQKASK